MMLDFLGQEQAASALMQAIESVTARRFFTRDLGGTAKTVEVTDRVLEEISKLSGGW